MNISKCAFSATVVNKRWIYTFGGYDGQKRLDNIERYDTIDKNWELLSLKLKYPLSNCACFSPSKNKVVVFGGGFSSGFSPYVEMIDIVSGEWKSMPIMTEGRDLRNKVVFSDDSAYAVGGLNRKAEKFNIKKQQWQTMPDYPVIDNLDSWSCAMTFVPKYNNFAVAAASISGEGDLGVNMAPEELAACLEGAEGDEDDEEAINPYNTDAQMYDSASGDVLELEKLDSSLYSEASDK